MSDKTTSHIYRFPTSFYHFLQVSSTSSKTNQSQIITQKAISSTQARCFSAESDRQSKELSNVLDTNATKSKVTLWEGNTSPQQTCDKLSDVSFMPQTYTFEDNEDFQTQNLASAALLLEDEEKPLTEFEHMLIKDGPEVPTGTPEFMEVTSRQSSCDGANDGLGSSAELLALPESPNSEGYFEGGEPGDSEQLSAHDGDAKTAEHLAHCRREDHIPPMIDQESEVCSHHLGSVAEGVSPTNTRDEGTHCREVLSIEVLQIEDVWSQSLSDATPETVTSARHFSFEEPALAPPPGASEYLGLSVTTKSEMTLSDSKEGHSSSPGGVDTVCSPRSTAENTKVEHSGKDSPGIDYSDPEGYFDCKQAPSDLSEPDDPDPCDSLGSAVRPEKAPEPVLLSSESDEYEDAPFVHEPPRVGHEDSEEGPRSSDPSDDEFTLCEASQPPAACLAGHGTASYWTRVR